MKNKFFTRNIMPAAQSLQVTERHGVFNENINWIIDWIFDTGICL